MEMTQVKKLADYVHQAEKEKREITKITSNLYPSLTIDEAYLIQEQLILDKKNEGLRIIGPKMGITSKAKMKQMNVDNPIYGFVFDRMVIEEDEQISMADYIHPKIEPEIGFILKKDLYGDDITVEEVLNATKYVFPAVEVIDSRYENFNFTLPDVIADNTSAAGAIFGYKMSDPNSLALDVLGASIKINGEVKAFGTGAAVLGHPAESIARLAQMLFKKGKAVKANEPILTGGMTEAIMLHAGDLVEVDFGQLGHLSFSVTP
ncbi:MULTISPECIES: 2-keto-4-pentenoate hydratase [Cytobacillus]|uniref:4-oxalocrotonate decarboxylase n=1 Tax=Cytobacillus stercorigallinarum TaxID=2762240 RepID=A0ABR8QT08_9BACI|nr:fumarylacetoacetate hydrolase family protein [Cytobacillus stercorigallinarum]MBD7938671.1 4-oxalocrotonate decarboxylase [Cytobacillus stercorigallinarum]